MRGSITFYVGLIAVLCGGVMPNFGRAQDPPSEAPSTESLEPSEQKVEVSEVVSDFEIQERIQTILEATTYFDDANVRVSDGVVFLSGSTTNSEHRTWAKDIAAKTEDVVAVVNQITVTEAQLWDLTPAWNELRDLSQQVIRSLPLVLIGLAFLLVMIFVARGAASISRRILLPRVGSVLVRNIVAKTVSLLVVLLGVYIFLRISGLTRLAVTVVGGTGVIGIVLGFAFRDIAENFLASLLLSLQRPFRIDDTIEVAGYIGVVRAVSPRGTTIVDFDGNYVHIANATVYKSTIKNFTAIPKTRASFTVGIGYDSGISKAQEILLGELQSHSAILDDPPPVVLVDSLGTSTINLKALFWVNTQKHSKSKVKSAVIRLGLRALVKNDISLPDEAREMIFPDGVPVRMLEAGETDQLAQERKARQEAREREESHLEVVKPEGDLSSDVEELQQEADEAPPRESGHDLLSHEGEEDESVKPAKVGSSEASAPSSI